MPIDNMLKERETFPQTSEIMRTAHQLLHAAAHLPRKQKLMIVVSIDALVLPLCYFLAVTLRLGAWAQIDAVHGAIAIALTGISIFAFARTGLYRAVLRFMDFRVPFTAVMALGAVIAVPSAINFLFGPLHAPRSAFAIFWLLAFAWVVLSRFSARALSRIYSDTQHAIPAANNANRKRVLIYGAGRAGVQLGHALRNGREYLPVGFIDDAPELRNKIVIGMTVHSPENLAQRIATEKIQGFIIAVPSATQEQRAQMVDRVARFGLPVKILPAIEDLMTGKVNESDVRNIDVADLLGRSVVPPIQRLLDQCIQGKVVMVTGGGGSIGSELCRQIMRVRPAKLVVYEHSEIALYSIDQELGKRFPNVPLVTVLGSVCDPLLLNTVIKQHGVQTIYHAAAYKHVPIAESNVAAVVYNNVFGSLAVAQAAQANDIAHCVLISTDKAVRPTNIMGASKRIAELAFQALAKERTGKTLFSMVRFGNVLGSSGSVVPLFKRQIANGGPVTLTHADITRYFMLIPEAAQLVIQAGAMARGGEVFVLDMGEPVKLIDLARRMIRLAGLTEKTRANPDGDIAIDVVGLRPGEKLYEELIIGDTDEASEHPKIRRARERMIEWDELERKIERLRLACEEMDEATARLMVHELVPEYHTPNYVQEVQSHTEALLRRVAVA